MADPCVSVLPGVSLPETAGLKEGYRLRRAPSLFGLPYEYPLSIQNLGPARTSQVLRCRPYYPYPGARPNIATRAPVRALRPVTVL